MAGRFERSVEIILSNQHPAGAYVACPNFPTYRYCWYRDASFCAYAMDLAGEGGSAGRFHAWAAQVINRRAAVVERALAKAGRGEKLAEEDMLHTRYTLEGEEGRQQEWANFQLDGFGTWLWALAQHARLSGSPLPAGQVKAAGLAVRYLAGLWRLPNFDCWEEFGDRTHPHTLAAIYGGLKAWQGQPGAAFGGLEWVLAEMRAAIEQNFVLDGHFVKFAGQPAVDASLLGLGVPYGVVGLEDARLRATVAEIERTLRQDGAGVHRYAADTYYGGGEWVLLAAWLGWYYALAGEGRRARGLLAWVEAQAGPGGWLPEQVPAHLNDPASHAPWVERWGPAASPLLWSHAMEIILSKQLDSLQPSA